MADKIFANGCVFKKREGAPEFVIGSLGIKVDDFKKFLDEHVKNNGWVDLDILTSKEGKPYVSLNTYSPEKPAVVERQRSQEEIDEEINIDDTPF